MKEGGGLVVLEEQDQRQAEPRERDNVSRIDDQAISAIEQKVADVVPHLTFELPDELAGGQRSIEDERRSVVGLAPPVPSLVPIPGTRNTVEAIYAHDAITRSLMNGHWTLDAKHVPAGSNCAHRAVGNWSRPFFWSGLAPIGFLAASAEPPGRRLVILAGFHGTPLTAEYRGLPGLSMRCSRVDRARAADLRPRRDRWRKRDLSLGRTDLALEPIGE